MHGWEKRRRGKLRGNGFQEEGICFFKVRVQVSSSLATIKGVISSLFV